MATFPIRESEIVSLAQSVINGLNTQAKTFPKSPFTAEEVQAVLDAFLKLRDALTALQAKLGETSNEKQSALADLTDTLKAVLRYIEGAADNDEQLAHFGWAGRRSAQALQAPGQCRALEALRRTDGAVFLDWKEPIDGGKPAYYTVEIREMPDGSWQRADNAVESEITLLGQPKGKTLEYRVYAANKAGNGAYSNVVEVVV